MPNQKFVVIGGNAAGMTAAAQVRRRQKDMIVKVFEKSPHVSYVP